MPSYLRRLAAVVLAAVTAFVLVPHSARAAVSTPGLDVGTSQHTLNWSRLPSDVRWVYIKTTEGGTWQSPDFNPQYSTATRRGLIRGGYHFAIPSSTTSAAGQARFFATHGGGWSRDGRTLPGALDLEDYPLVNGRQRYPHCYGLSQRAMVAWIQSFANTYRSLTGRDAVIYTNPGWWTSCTGNTRAFSRTNPLWLARWASTPGALPGGWPFYTIWQSGHINVDGIQVDYNRFNGDLSRLRALATG